MKVALIADVHSNLEALNAVLEDIKRLRVNKIICCGDIIGYGASPNECCYLIKTLKIPTVMGNHDFACLELKDLNKFNPYAQEVLRWTNKQLLKENKDFLSKLPKTYEEKIGEFKIHVVHGSPKDPLFEYTVPGTPNNVLKGFLEKTKSDILVMGHTHVPFVKRFLRKLVINPGGVGQPRDNRPQASYAVLDTETLRVDLNRIAYDIGAASSKIITAGLPRFLAERLYQGR